MLRSSFSLSDLDHYPEPQADWRVLILAADSTAIAQAVARQVRQVTLGGWPGTAELQADELRAEPLPENIRICRHSVERLPYGDEQFDLIICHHFSHLISDIGGWLSKAARILTQQGQLALTTYLVPGTRLRGKKARTLRSAGEYINAWIQLGNPQHRRFYSQNSWDDMLSANGFVEERQNSVMESFEFNSWMEMISPTDKDRLRLEAMLRQAPEKVGEFLTPQFSEDKIVFRLPEITILATL